MIRSWLSSPAQETPEHMAKLTYSLIHDIFQKYVGKIYPALSEPETARQKPGHGREELHGYKTDLPGASGRKADIR